MTLNGAAAGNLLTASCVNQTNATATFSVADGANTWANAISQGGVGKTVQILYAKNVAGGDTVVAVTANASITFTALVEEWSGSDISSPLAAADSNTDSAASTSHLASAAGISPSAPCIALVAAGGQTGFGTKSAGAGYTLDTASQVVSLREYVIFASPPTAERGAFTSGNSVKAVAVIAAFKAAATAPSGPGQIIGGAVGRMMC